MKRSYIPLIVVVGAAALVGVLLLGGYALGSLLGEGGSIEDEALGVTVDDGVVVLLACEGRTIGHIAIRQDSAYTGPMAWEAYAFGGRERVIRLDAKVPNYRVIGERIPAASSSTFFIVEADDGAGGSLNSYALEFRPKDLAEGMILTARGELAESDIRAESERCRP